jgi:hypothetical protein
MTPRKGCEEMSETESRLLKAVNYNCGYALMDACQEIDAGKIIMDERGNEIDRLRAENEHLNNIINSTTVNIGYMEDNDRLRAALAAMIGQRNDTCTWLADDMGAWETSCGVTWEFNDGGPKENNAVFCHHCGKRILAKNYIDETEEE